MKKLIAGGITALALAAAVPLVATAGHGERGDDGGHGMRGSHHGEHGMRGGQHGEHGMRGHYGDHHGGGEARIRLTEMLGTYDADGDGSVTQAEVDEWRANRLREFDADGDGQLSLDEYQALWLDAMRERMVDQFQEHDDDGDGQVTVDEFGERTSRLVMMRDQNEDGVLNLDDTRRGRRGGDRPREGVQEGAPSTAQPEAQQGGSEQGGTTEQQ
jgi:Ca2+-binding EF-hand superfamily protein